MPLQSEIRSATERRGMEDRDIGTARQDLCTTEARRDEAATKDKTFAPKHGRPGVSRDHTPAPGTSGRLLLIQFSKSHEHAGTLGTARLDYD